MKKLLEISLGPGSDTRFALDGRLVQDEDALGLIKKECNPYKTEDSEGVLVYMSRQEYEELQKPS